MEGREGEGAKIALLNTKNYFTPHALLSVGKWLASQMFKYGASCTTLTIAHPHNSTIGMYTETRYVWTFTPDHIKDQSQSIRTNTCNISTADDNHVFFLIRLL